MSTGREGRTNCASRTSPIPKPSAGEVRIAVTAAGTNPVDASNRADGSWAGIQFPHVPGYDVAGVIDAMGAGVTRVGVGDTVMAMTSFPRGRRLATPSSS